MWGASTAVESIFKVQKSAIRALSGVSSRSSCRDLFRVHNILTLPSLFILTCLEYVHGSSGKFVLNSDRHNYNTRHQNNFLIPLHRIGKSQMNTNYLAMKLYNKLPNNFKELPQQKFKKCVKTVLYDNCFYSIEEFLNCQF